MDSSQQSVRLCFPVLKAGLLYFALVFGIGFLFGIIRVPLLVPNLGERCAELIAMPFMFGGIVLSSRLVLKRIPMCRSRSALLLVGLLASGLLLAVEFTVVLNLRGLTLGEYVSSRDPVAGLAYSAMLAIYAVMPAIVGRRRLDD